MSQRSAGALSLTMGRQGFPIVNQGSPLIRLHYYDGKFLRAADLDLEQRYLRTLAHLSNQAGGAGVVHGYSASIDSDDTLLVGEGLAIDFQGRVLLLQSAASVPVAQLVGAASTPSPYGNDVIVRPLPQDRVRDLQVASPAGMRAEAVGRTTMSTAAMRTPQGWMLTDNAISRPGRDGEFTNCQSQGSDGTGRLIAAPNLFLIVISHAEELCGHEDVHGRLCEAACTTRSERPYYVEGIVVRAIPLSLDVALGQAGPIVLGVNHLRSRVASAYFKQESATIASLISKEGLASDTWCLGAEAITGNAIPIGVLARAGGTTTFFDAWIARRERMDAPPKQYWAWRMSMRPWSVFLSHVLQFQCQLHDLFSTRPGPGATDPCRDSRGLIEEATGALSSLNEYYEKVTGVLARMRVPEVEEIVSNDAIRNRLGGYKKLAERLGQAGQGPATGTRMLIRGGIVELPSAGYLPVARTSELSVNEQVRNLLGEGVDLRFCVVRPDFVPHALEEAQHMERISLLEGLSNAAARPRVDILVPNGEFVEKADRTIGMAFAGRAQFVTTFVLDRSSASLAVRGAARGERLESGGVAFHFAGVGQPPPPSEFATFIRGFDNLSEVRERGSFGGIEPSEAVVPEGVRRVREAVHRVAPGRTLTIRDGNVRGTPEGLPGSAIEQSTANKVSALWATLRCDRDPFALQVGQEAALDGRFIIAVPTARVSMADITIKGPLRIADVTPAFNLSDRCRGFVTLDVAWVSHLGGNQQEQFKRLVAAIELDRLDRPEGARILVRLTFQQEAAVVARQPVVLSFETTISGSPTSAKAEGSLAFGEQGQPVLNSSFIENAEVLNAQNSDHELAITSLEVIDAVLAEPAFKAHAEQLLFPAARTAQSEQVLRPTLDWVLFHRRRDKECGGAPAVVEVKNRRYKVYAGLIKTPDQAQEVIEALRRNSGAAAVRRAQFVPAGVVEFGSGTANLLTGPAALAAEWNAVPKGNRIIIGAIANEGESAQDGTALSLSRLRQLEVALDPLGMRIDPAALSEMLPAVPAPTLTADDTDGIIAIVTYPFVNLRTARVVFYRPAGADGVRRVTNRVSAAEPIPDIVLTFRDNTIVEDEGVGLLIKMLHELTARSGSGSMKVDTALPEPPDQAAQARANSIAEFLKLRTVNSAAGRPYQLVDPRAVVAARPLRSSPDERSFLNEANREVEELVAFMVGD